MAQADALAKMTVELNLRAVSAQAERLEQEVKELVVGTSQDKEFLSEHQERIMDIWREVVAVKTRMDQVKDKQQDTKVEFDKCQRETADFKLQLRREMDDLKGLMDGVASQLDSLPTAAELKDAAPAESNAEPHPMETRSMTRAGAPKPPSRRRTGAPGASPQVSPGGQADGSTDCSSQPPERRIQEAIKSTRRWHRDHKTTTLADAEFVASYLKQQSKRDAAMAVFIQKAIQRRIQSGQRPGSSCRPRSLEDFCRGLTWKDVTDAIELALVKEERATVEVLRREGKVSAME